MAKTRQDYLDEYSVLLGEAFMNANQRMRKEFVFYLVKLNGLDNCFRCGKPILSADDCVYDHVKSWRKTKDNEFSADNFFDPSNILFSHNYCNGSVPCGGKGEHKTCGVVTYKGPSGKICLKSYIRKDGREVCLGHFPTVLEAAIAHDIGLLRLHVGKGILHYEQLRPFYTQLLSQFRPEEEYSLFYRNGPIKGLVRQCLSELTKLEELN